MQNSSITMNTALKEYYRIFREINLIYQETAQSLGLSHSAFDIYYAICQLGDGCRQKDIADHTFLSKQTINSTIHQMEKDGLITLRPGKGRSRNIYLTPLGQDIIYAKIRPVIDCENRSFDTMTPADAEVLLQSSNTYISHLRAAFSDLLGKDTKQ